MIELFWRHLKVWRRLRFGPVAFHFSFRKAVPVKKRNGRLKHRGTVQPQTGSAKIEAQHAATRGKPEPISPGTAMIVGVGPGFGYALARRLAREGYEMALVSRRADRLDALCEELSSNGVIVESYGMDATHETDVRSTFSKVISKHGTPSLVVYSLQEFGPGTVLDVSVPAFESAWRHNCLGAFLVSQSAGRAMKMVGKGSIVLVGSTSSIIGRAGHINLAVGKFGQRALAQVLSRELWPFGIHVAHVLIDADIAEPGSAAEENAQSDPDDIASSILALHKQPRSAWSSEIDLRPWNEVFWEHC